MIDSPQFLIRNVIASGGRRAHVGAAEARWDLSVCLPMDNELAYSQGQLGARRGELIAIRHRIDGTAEETVHRAAAETGLGGSGQIKKGGEANGRPYR
jgi:hypothetical protein